MECQKIDLEQVKMRYIQWLDANKRSFNFRRERFVNSMDWIEPDAVVNADSILQYGQGRAVSRPTAYRLLSELFKADILVKAANGGIFEFAVKSGYFHDGDDSDIK